MIPFAVLVDLGVKIKSIGPIREDQWSLVANKLFAMGKKWHDGDSFIEFNPFEALPNLKDKKICVHQNNRGFFFKENEGAEISVEEFLGAMTTEQEFKKPRLEAIMAHIQAQYIEDCNSERFELSVKEALQNLEETWKAVNEPTWFESGRFKWIPKIGEFYWLVSFKGEPTKFKFQGDTTDHSICAFGNCFQTEQAAIEARDKMRELLLGL